MAGPLSDSDKARLLGAPGPEEEEGRVAPHDPRASGPGLISAIQDLIKYFQSPESDMVKPGSASNDARYEKTLEDAGMSKDDTGIGG
jgi:hypothetical protein